MPNLGFVNAELIVQEGGLAPLVELLSSSNEVGGQTHMEILGGGGKGYSGIVVHCLSSLVIRSCWMLQRCQFFQRDGERHGIDLCCSSVRVSLQVEGWLGHIPRSLHRSLHVAILLLATRFCSCSHR
jgi:hypothetical protein